MDNEQFSVPTPAGRTIGRLLLAAGVLLLLLIYPLSHWYVRILENIGDEEQSRRILIVSAALPAILFAALTSWLFGLGHKTISSRHWPPQGLPVLYRIRIHNGRPAIINGVICFLAGGITGLITLLWFYMTWKSWNL